MQEKRANIGHKNSTHSNTSSCEEDIKSVFPAAGEKVLVTPKKVYTEKDLHNLIEGPCISNSQQDEEPEFSSLAFINKRMNKETEKEIYLEKYLPEVSLSINRAKIFSWDSGESRTLNNSGEKEPSTDELLEALKEFAAKNLCEDLLTISEDSDKSLEIFKTLFMKITELTLSVDQNDNICLWIDMEDEKQREFMTTVADVKLPAIDVLLVENFYEGDEDLENFLSNSISTVNSIVLKAEGFWVDFHDYWEKITELVSTKHLYLKGFLIDSEDAQNLLGKMNWKKIIFESWNIAVEEDFLIKPSNSTTQNSIPILKSIHFIDSEMELESMKILIRAIKESELASAFKEVSVNDWVLSQEQVNSLLN